MIQGRWFPVGGDIAEALCVRERVFSRSRDELDDRAQQVVVYDANDAPVGAARLWWADGAFRLGDLGVLSDKRGQGFGDLLVRLLLFKSLTHGASLISLSAPAQVAPFFAKYGFAAQDDAPDASGETFMSIRAQDVQLSHCGGNCAECGHPSEECVPKALR